MSTPVTPVPQAVQPVDSGNPEVAQVGSLSSHLSGLVPKAVLDSAPGRFVTSTFDNSSVGAKANFAKEYYNSVTTPAKEPGGNIINDMATSLWHAHADEFNKADQYSKAAQHAKSFGDWASNTSQSLGHLGAAALPVIGPSAAKAGERIGTGDIAGGLGAGAGLIASTLLGGAATEKMAAKLGLGAKAAGAVGKVAGEVPSAPKLEAVYKAKSTPGTILHSHDIEAHANGVKVGTLSAKEEAGNPGSWRVEGHDVHPSVEGQGVDKGMYNRLVQHAKENGAHEIHSGGITTPEEAKMWEGLSKKEPVDRISSKDPKTGEIQTQYRMKLDKQTPTVIQPASMPAPEGFKAAADALSKGKQSASPAPPTQLQMLSDRIDNLPASDRAELRNMALYSDKFEKGQRLTPEELEAMQQGKVKLGAISADVMKQHLGLISGAQGKGLDDLYEKLKDTTENPPPEGGGKGNDIKSAKQGILGAAKDQVAGLVNVGVLHGVHSAIHHLLTKKDRKE
jgi:hypothetical protein